jgi:hypothetical protein
MLFATYIPHSKTASNTAIMSPKAVVRRRESTIYEPVLTTASNDTLTDLKPLKRVYAQYGRLFTAQPVESHTKTYSPPSLAPQRPTFLTLPNELHTLIAKHLPPASIHILTRIPNHRLRSLYVSPPDPSSNIRSMELELLSRDVFEAIVRPHISIYGKVRPQRFTDQEWRVIYRTVFYCYACDRGTAVQHYPWEQVERSLKFEGEEKWKVRKCSGSVLPVELQRGMKVSWRDMQRAGNELLEKLKEAVETAKDDNGRDGANGTANPVTTTAATGYFPPLYVDIPPSDRPLGSAQRRKNKSRFFPPQYLRLYHVDNTSPNPQPYFLADYVNYHRLRIHWSQDFKKTLRAIRLAIVLAQPRFCNHMSAISLVLRSDYDGCLQTSFLRHMVESLSCDHVPWDDSMVENGVVVQRKKSMGIECAVEGCRTEVDLERACCLVRKGDDRKTRKNKARLLGKCGRKEEKWKEYVWVVVRRKWEVTSPSGKEWRVVVGIE